MNLKNVIDMRKYIFYCLLVIPIAAHSQFENRLNLYVSIGTIPFQPDSEIQSESIFQGYRSTPYLHAYLGYSLNRKLSMGGSLRQIVTSKENYLLSNTCIGYGVKYNFLPFDKPISPFIYTEAGINYTFVSQSQNTQVIQYSTSTDPTSITVEETTLQEPEIQLNIFPSLSAIIAVGAEFTLKSIRKKNLGLYLMCGYSASNTAEKNSVKENFPNNTSQFNYFLISAGVRFSFIQRKSLY